MSVRRPERNQSDAEFLANARRLESETRRRCASGPKRYTFYGLQELYQTARAIYRNVKKGNTQPPLNQHEAQIRRDYFCEAVRCAEDMNSQIELLLEDGVLEPKDVAEMSRLVHKQVILMRALMKSDRQRYKNLPG